jgi:hypothetical protein
MFSLTFEIIFSSNFLITCTKKLFEATAQKKALVLEQN